MERGIADLEFDEFEKLLGEIPDATSHHPNSEKSSLTRSSKGTPDENFNINRTSVSKDEQSFINRVPLDESYLPSIRDSRVMPSPNNAASTLGGFDVKRNSQESSSLFNLDAQELKKQQINYCQPIENYTGAMPLANGVQGFQFLPNMPLHGVEFPVFSDQKDYFLDTQLQPQQMSQPHIKWKHMNEERLYNMHQQYLYLQQFRNLHLENQNSVRANGNVPTRLPRQNLQLSHRTNEDPFWNMGPIPMHIIRANPIIPSPGFNTGQVLDKLGNHSFPEKILTRSHGLNSLRSVKFGSFAGTDSFAKFNQHERLFSNDDVKHNNMRPLHQKFYSADELAGEIYLLAKDQHGCRFLQRKFTEGTEEDIEKIFAEIIVHIVELMTDPFGNYLVQKLLEVCDEDKRMKILHGITRNAGDLVRISCDMHGTRAVQKVIETLKTPEQFSLAVSSLKPGIVTLIKDMNGNHVAQRCLQYLKPEYSEFLFEAATANCVELATDRHGCCVLQKCLTHSDGERRCRLISEITSNALLLSEDPFGNYVVQFVFEIDVSWATGNILDQLVGNYGDLSMQKYGSNVVEKCLKYAGEERRPCIIHELINNPRLDQIMQDPYGNYVIQAALNHSKGGVHGALVEAIRPHVPLLRTSPYGKKVLSSISLKK